MTLNSLDCRFWVIHVYKGILYLGNDESRGRGVKKKDIVHYGLIWVKVNENKDYTLVTLTWDLYPTSLFCSNRINNLLRLIHGRVSLYFNESVTWKQSLKLSVITNSIKIYFTDPKSYGSVRRKSEVTRESLVRGR